MVSALGFLPLLLVTRRTVDGAARQKTEADARRTLEAFQDRFRSLERQSQLAASATFKDKALYPELVKTREPEDLGLGDAADPGSVLEDVRDILDSADMPLLKGPGGMGRMELLLIANPAGRLVYSATDSTAPHELLDEEIVRAAIRGRTSSELWTNARARKYRPGTTDPLLLVVATRDTRSGAILLRGVGVSPRSEHDRAKDGVTRAPPLLEELQDFAEGEVAVVADGVVASTLPLTLAELPAAANQGVAEATLGGTRYLVRGGDVDPERPAWGHAYLIRPFDRELGSILKPVDTATGITGVLVLLGSFAVASVVARRMSRPIVELEQAARRVGRGELDLSVPRTTSDEVGRLADEFNEMVRGLRQREQIKGLFKRYLNPQVVDELIRDPSKAAPGGERRVLTLLFSDLVDFTALAEAMSPEDVVQMLNGYFEQAGRSLAAHDATIDKFIGDAIMCFWNAPLLQADHARRGCLAALDLIAATERVSRDLESRGQKPLRCRVGVHTGPAVVGNIGSKELQDYTAIGDAVNLASRLEGAAKLYGTRSLASEDTVVAAGDAVVARELDLLVVKGKTRPVRVYELLGRKGAALGPHVQRYGEGLELYRARKFSQAAQAFRASPEDPPARALALRCEQHAAAPPPDDWQGELILGR